MTAPTLEDVIYRMIPAWSIGEWLSDPKVARSRCISGYYHASMTIDGQSWQFGTTRDGFTVKSWGTDVDVLYRWRDITERIQAFAYRKETAELLTLNRKSQEHMRTFVPWRASREAQGCGPRREGEEPSPARLLYEKEYDEWWTKHAEPYHKRSGELDKRRDAIYRDLLAEPLQESLF